MRRTVTLVLLLAACGRSETASSQIPAYLVGDPCHGRSDAQSCGADPTCQWMPLGIACAVGAPCISGVCEEVDPCRAHADPEFPAYPTNADCGYRKIQIGRRERSPRVRR